MTMLDLAKGKQEMPEPNTTVAAGILIGSGIGLTGTLMGAQADALIIGLIAAVLISFWLPTIDDKRKAASSVALSSLMAGYGSPIAAAWLDAAVDSIHYSDQLRLLMAVAIGSFCPTLVPVIIGWAKRHVENQA